MINTFALLLPVFLLIVFIEWYVSNKKQDKKYNTGNIMMNLTIGAIDQIGSLFYFVCLYVVLDYVYVNYCIFDMHNAWYQWVLAYIVVDFVSYWYHRWSHRINILWAGHVTHHSSELYNFSNGFRTSLFQGVNRILFWAIMPVFGFSPMVLVITLKVSGLYDFLVHTQYIPKLGFLEKIFITPSLHRVHHGKNDIYIDKNYGSTFLIWDQLFGTYQPETEKVQYGIKGTYIDNNPFKAIGHHYFYLLKTIKNTHAWSDKIKLLVMPPEWKPINLIEDEKPILKNTTPLKKPLKKYAIVQMIICVLGIIILLTYKNFLNNWELLLCALIGIVNMAFATMLYNKNYTNNFITNEWIRLLIEAVLIATTIIVYTNYYLLFVLIVLLATSLFLYQKKISL
jgi:sterol desaturase/sphingolipid hydroxylase (fatty acid hydroxylase superfamily)